MNDLMIFNINLLVCFQNIFPLLLLNVLPRFFKPSDNFDKKTQKKKAMRRGHGFLFRAGACIASAAYLYHQENLRFR